MALIHEQGHSRSSQNHAVLRTQVFHLSIYKVVVLNVVYRSAVSEGVTSRVWPLSSTKHINYSGF